MLLKRIHEDEEQLEIIPDEQWGFQTRHSIEDQVMRMVEDAMTNMENKRALCVIYFNVEIRYDEMEMAQQGFGKTL